MSFVHHEPDLAHVPCLGCNEAIAPANVFRHRRHYWKSCCFWHPYHFWCIRTGPPPAATFAMCAECRAPLPPATVDTMVQWIASFDQRVHGTAVPRPALGVRAVCLWWPPDADISSKITPSLGVPALAGERIDIRPMLEERFELVHDDCTTDDAFRAQLRAAPGDTAARTVYADFLEAAGDPRADFVRAVIRREHMTGTALALLDEHLFELRQALQSAWCRDVAQMR